MKKSITTLAELRAEKEKLKQTMEITRNEFAQSIGTNKTQMKDFLLKRAALPVGILGAATTGYKMMSSSSDNKNPDNTSNANLILNNILPIAINIVSAYFMKKKANEALVQPKPAKVISNKKVDTEAIRDLETTAA